MPLSSILMFSWLLVVVSVVTAVAYTAEAQLFEPLGRIRLTDGYSR